MNSGTYLYIALTNAKPGAQEEYEDWLLKHHLRDVLAVEGVTTAQQFRHAPTIDGISAPFHYAAMYTAETDDIRDLHARILHARRSGLMTDTATLANETSAHWYMPISELLRKSAQ